MTSRRRFFQGAWRTMRAASRLLPGELSGARGAVLALPLQVRSQVVRLHLDAEHMGAHEVSIR
jgi:hypothetical protein